MATDVASDTADLAALTLSPISHQIWDMKYRLHAADGTPIDGTVEDTWRRVAKAIAAAESDPAQWEPVFYDALDGFKFIPAGRILAGAGTDRRVTLFNCYVMGTIPDDMGGIFNALREAALTMQQGGGIGYDFSTLRPKGAPVHGVGADASGPLSFMDVWDSMCRTIMSAGSRRGAMMATLRADHPDIEAFVDAKRDPRRLRMFNVSVLATDAFMDAVKNDTNWDLVFAGTVYRTIRARDLWDRIMRATYEYAEPGVIFIDRINDRNNLYYCETIAATNPCGEQPLPPYGACLLGSINLAALVENPFTDDAGIDEQGLADLVTTSIRMLDNVIDVSRFPLEAQRDEAIAKRRIGLGITGLADALIMCGIRYGSSQAVKRAAHWAKLIQDAAYRASAELAAEKGAFPLYDAELYLHGSTVRAIDADVRQIIDQKGMRNALVTSIAPTGTISLLAGNISSGIEPVFSFEAQRNVLMPDGTKRQEQVTDYAYRLFRQIKGEDAKLPDYFVDAQTLTPQDHLVMQAAVQHHVDSSISKTINCPAGIAFEDFQQVYRKAYEMGCKGCTTYRPNDVTGSVLSVAASPAAEPAPSPSAPQSPPLSRPAVLPGQTYKLKWPESDHAIYITINDTVEDGTRRPFEIFINSKNMDHYAWTVALTRMISGVFRRGGDVSFVVEELQAVFDPRGGAWMNRRYVPSLLAAIGDVIEQHMAGIGLVASPDAAPVPASVPDAGSGGKCPRCAAPALVHQEGCLVCTNCGYSRCG
jgi:ribonucleoside-diphosphate reductase alpha chain